jgi:hypothetical protein
MLVETELKAVKSDGIVWIIKGNLLYMTDNEGNYFTPFEPGSETYLYKFKQLNNLKPLPESERVTILSKLLNNIKELL